MSQKFTNHLPVNEIVGFVEVLFPLGYLAPIMIAATDQGIILFTPNKLSDFANKVRLISAEKYHTPPAHSSSR
jgi:hypothetical protein